MLTKRQAARPRRVARIRSGRATEARTGRSSAASVGLRERIVAAAGRLCFASGVEAVSARKIAAEIGCSATAIYLHFASIEHVLHEIRMEGHAMLVEYLRRPPETLDAVERLCQMQRAYHRFATENPSYFRVMFLSRVDAAPLGQLVAAEGASLDIVRTAAALGRERGEIDRGLDPLVVANVCWMSVHGLSSMVVSGHAAVTAPGLADRLLDSLTEATRAWLRIRPRRGRPR